MNLIIGLSFPMLFITPAKAIKRLGTANEVVNGQQTQEADSPVLWALHL